MHGDRQAGQRRKTPLTISKELFNCGVKEYGHYKLNH